MALIDKIQDSNFGLKGITPEKIDGTDLSSDTHVFDPTPGVAGDEKITFQSIYALPTLPKKGSSDSNFETGGSAIGTRD